MRDAQAKTTYLKDYTPPWFFIEHTDLVFHLFEDHALVIATLDLVRNAGHVTGEGVPHHVDTLVLDGQGLQLESIFLDGKALDDSQYSVDNESLSVAGLTEILGREPDSFRFQCTTRIEPQNNTLLEGLYKSQKMFCTQCEAEGFRRITYYLDRPDVMSRFTTTIHADKERYPVLLSNGNKVGSGAESGDPARHWVTWEDPFRKPSYLFALVAGDLVSLDDEFTTMGGRKVDLQIFVEPKDLDKCAYAMDSLKRAMAWDEKVYGREYDLDIFMIVAVDDFNMGAMENKGLNIFNTSCVLANPLTTTDQAFQRVEAVVAHEYFHNWSGNRVTCRDWFQLSLKEGFTVFRDSEFSADMGSRTVKRVEDVSFLRTVQFAEDGGPMAHSVRPDSYMEISNFYTVTIYEKGAEVVRMMSLLLGPDAFRRGTDLYFERHDGQAVTTEDFVEALEDASGVDLGQFRNWYSQAGTPRLKVSAQYDSDAATYTLHFEQSCPDTPGQTNKQPFHIPVRLGLLGKDGGNLALCIDEQASSGDFRREDGGVLLGIKSAKETFRFEQVHEEPVPSLLRGFSAPVRLDFDYSRDDLLFLMVNDSDGFNRWNAAQQLAISCQDELQKVAASGGQLQLPAELLAAYRGVLEGFLQDPGQDMAMIAYLLILPAESTLIELAETADVEAIHTVREFLANGLAHALGDSFEQLFLALEDSTSFRVDAESIGRRSLKNLALSYLVRGGEAQWLDACNTRFRDAGNMTDQFAALRCLAHSQQGAAADLKREALSAFYTQWRDEPLVVNQWFSVQATSPQQDCLQQVKTLMQHEAFEIRNPNKVRSLIGAFCGQNHVRFHAKDGSGYEFLADQVLALDALNPQIASRLLTPLTRWRKFDDSRQGSMQAQLQRIKLSESLSRDVFEVVEKSTL